MKKISAVLLLFLSGCLGSGSGSSGSGGPGTFANSTITLSRNTGVPANGISQVNITVTLLNSEGEPISGEEISISATGQGNEITQPTSTTNEDGEATGSIVSDEEGVKVISITVDPSSDESTTLSQTVSISFGDLFGEVENFSVGGTPSDLKSADFDGDGVMDLIVSNSGSGTVSTMFGKALGSSAFVLARLDDEVGTGPSGVAVGDLDGDGDTDAVVSNNTDSTVSVLLNEGAGTFAQEEDAMMNFAFPTADTGPEPVAVIAVDLDGDDDLDLVSLNNDTGNANAGSVSVLLGAGDGTFGPKTDTAIGTDPVIFVSGDFDGDDDVDLVVLYAGTPGTIEFIENNGAGGFSPAGTTEDTGDGPSDLAVGDLNEDGDLDVVTANTENTEPISVFIGNGSGGFATATDPVDGFAASGIALADLNGSGNLDAVVTSGGNIRYLLGDGTGLFDTSTVAETFGTGGTATKVLVQDLSGGGIADVSTLAGNSVGYLTFPSN